MRREGKDGDEKEKKRPPEIEPSAHDTTTTPLSQNTNLHLTRRPINTSALHHKPCVFPTNLRQETAQTHHAALVTLKKQTVRLREDKERAERALQEMRVRHNETEAGAQVGETSSPWCSQQSRP